MTATSAEWYEELGVSTWSPPKFFRSVEEIDAEIRAPSQAHALRRAFQQMKLNGIVCLQNSPAIYFREITKDELANAEALHRRFWNQGLAPVLVLIDPDTIHVYSGLSLPQKQSNLGGETHHLVETLNRVAQAAEIRQLVLSVESGEYFSKHVRSFDPKQRVDRDLLKNLGATREALMKASDGEPNHKLLDALLCRIVFVCYLFDRGIIDEAYLREKHIPFSRHVRDIFGLLEAKTHLYTLFEQLGIDFNGDLFIDDLVTEANYINDHHLTIISRFLRGMNIETGQSRFWPYEFDAIPIETISAIYERFLKAENPDRKRQSGAFYTPRFLAEVTIDIATESLDSLLNLRFLDPACGSGIFLVGLFNRIAEEWKRRHPTAGYDRTVSALIKVLRNNLSAVDINPTACRIAAFSLYLAFLDQLSPPDIRLLQRRGKLLPPLVCYGSDECAPEDAGRTIHQGDFFSKSIGIREGCYDVVIGNPPWATSIGSTSTAEKWCHENGLPIASRQLAIGFIWKAVTHQTRQGRICFVLPAMLLFNHKDTAVDFQGSWLNRHRIDLLLNLADMRFNLFSDATGPAVIARYSGEHPEHTHRIKYHIPKTSWSISQAEIVTVVSEDRTEIRLSDVNGDISRGRPPLVFKERFWGTPRDWKFLDRLSSLPRLSDIVGQTRERYSKRWVMAEGFKPELADGKTDHPVKRPWPNESLFLDSNADGAELFLLPSDTRPIGDQFPTLHRTVSAEEIFKGPHVLVWYGMRVAFADFDVLFRHSIRGIHGPVKDRNLLMFLTAYLRSPLARYFQFHTSANWGIERSKVHMAEVLRSPFMLPEHGHSPELCERVVQDVATLIDRTMSKASDLLHDRESSVRNLQDQLDHLVYQYFDIDDNERRLIDDTDKVIIKSILPAKASSEIPTLGPSSPKIRREYLQLLCDTVNSWTVGGDYRIHGRLQISSQAGIGVVILTRSKLCSLTNGNCSEGTDLISVMHKLRKIFSKEMAAVEILRGIKVIHENTLYILKSLNYRFWTSTAALNDADDIAATVLHRTRKRNEEC